MKVVIYTRVSRDAQGGRSVAEQEQECRAWVEREGWELLDVYSDNDCSASQYSRKARPSWQALMERLDQGGIDALIVWEASRATRDRKVWAVLAATCEEQGTKIGVSGRLYDFDDPDDAFQLDLTMALGNRESKQTKKRVDRTVNANVTHGTPHGKLLYGYRREYRDGPKGPVMAAQVEKTEQADIVRECAQRVARGEALYAVAADLNERKVPAPRAAADLARAAADLARAATDQTRAAADPAPDAADPAPDADAPAPRKGRWDPTQIRRLCTNPSYIGQRTHGGKVVGKASWPAILDEVTFWSCVQRMSDPSRRTNEGRGARHLLSGIAVCGSCGGRMHAQPNRGYPSYVCAQGFCVSRKQDAVDELVTMAVVTRLAQPDVLELMADTTTSADIEEAKAEVAEKQARLDSFCDAAAKGELTAAALSRIEKTLQPEITAAEKRCRPVVASPLLAESAGPDAEKKWVGRSLEQKREIIGLLCDIRILPVGKGRRTFDPAGVEITWRTS